MKRNTITTTVAIALAAVGTVTSSGQASAVPYQITTNQGLAYVQSAPSVSVSTVTTVPNGAAVNIICQTAGDKAGVAPYPSNATWDYVEINGARGYVSDMRTTTPGNGTRENLPNGGYFLSTVGIQRCGTVPAGPSIAAGSTPSLRTGPSPSHAIVGSLPGGASVTMHCWQDGGWATGIYSSNRWFRVSGAGLTGFVHSSFVLNQTTVPACATVVNPVVAGARISEEAISWMTGRMNLSPKTTNSAYAGGSSQNNQYHWWCAKAVWDAFTHGRTVVGLNAQSAIDLWHRVPSQHKRSGDTNPPRGAQVFYNHTGYGHTGISLGNGQIITTNGPGGVVAVLPLGAFPNYLGWSPFAG
jgi:uncharacterized protein YraI